MLSASKTLRTLYIYKVMWDSFSNHYIRPGIIIVNPSRTWELYMDPYGTDNPHLRLLATITTVIGHKWQLSNHYHGVGRSARGGHH